MASSLYFPATPATDRVRTKVIHYDALIGTTRCRDALKAGRLVTDICKHGRRRLTAFSTPHLLGKSLMMPSSDTSVLRNPLHHITRLAQELLRLGGRGSTTAGECP